MKLYNYLICRIQFLLMVIFRPNLMSNVGIKASKKAPVLQLNQHFFNANRSLFAINSVKHFIDKRALKTLYNSLVHSHFLYCIPIWGYVSKSSFKSLNFYKRKQYELFLFQNIMLILFLFLRKLRYFQLKSKLYFHPY